MGYNGYENYETWACALWIDNDEGNYHHIQRLVNEADDTDDLESTLRDWIEESKPLANDCSMFSDMMNSAIGRISWRELAEGYWAEYREADAFQRISSESEYIEYASKFGSLYFSPDTMRFFGTKTYHGLIRRDGLICMRISDIYWDGSRVYSIVVMDVAGNVSRIKQAENLSSKRACDRVWAKLEKGESLD